MKQLPRLLLLLALGSLPGLAAASDALLPRPAALEPAVQFWIRVYTEITTDAGFMHDQQDLSIVYETLHFEPDTSAAERQRKVDAEKVRLHDVLTRLARGAAPADETERQVRSLWGAEGTPARLAEAADDVRFQLGQADRFRAGLIRAGAWQRHIADVLARLGLPPELSALPHVESSFDPIAYSKDGAAGLWQFLRSTGRRFLRINSTVDERFDPFRETEAAAQLLAYNYRLLGSWPLAITAYNHGAAGMLRARDELGTDDIVRVLHDYHSPSFGFASRNFYVSFLAALSVAQDPNKYFGQLHPDSEIQFDELKMPTASGATTLVRAVGIDRHTLERLNPALRPAVWDGRRSIPAGYVLRLPDTASALTSQLLAQRLSAAPGETLAVATGPAAGSKADGHATAARLALASANKALNAVPGPAASASSSFTLASTARVTVFQPGAPSAVVELSAAAPGASPLAASSQYYLVRAQDTVSSIANQVGVPLARLMALNSLPDQDFLYEGEPLRLAGSVPEPGLDSPQLLALAQQAIQENREEQQLVALARRSAATAEPVSAAQAQAEGPQLAPGATGLQWADPIDYSVADDGSIRVVAAETLGHYAEWLDTSAARLRELNQLRSRTPVVMGARLKLDFSVVTRAQFEQRRRDYHERLQAAYFAAYRISGTGVYVARRGDSLWNITKRNLKIPVWLLQQYNPNLNFAALKPGTQVSLPQVEEIAPL